MNEFPQATSETSLADRDRGLRYLMAAAAANAALWGIALLLVKDAPRIYVSQWSLIFPGDAAKTVGLQTRSSSANSATDRYSQDIKAAYQLIATTDEVRKAAAAKLGMTTEQFGNPNVEALSGTAVMKFEMGGSTPEEAQKKAYALEEAFQERLTQLRVQQVSEQELGFENSLSIARKKLEASQFRLADYKVRSGLASKEQIDQLASNIETLRRLRAEAIAQQQDVRMQSQQLSSDLNASPQLATDAFILRSDPLFQQYAKDYSEATANLTAVSTKFGPNHPVVVRETARQKAIQEALQSRGQEALGHPFDLTTIARLNLGGDTQAPSARESLLKDIMTSRVEQQGLGARVQELDRQLAQLEQRLSVLAQRSSTLDALNRDVQIAESIFSSTLANLDASKVDNSSSYPPVQVAAEPNLPQAAGIPIRKPLFALTTIGSLLVTGGLLVLWLRKTPLSKRWLPQYRASRVV